MITNTIVFGCLIVILIFKILDFKRTDKEEKELWEYSERILDITERR